MTEFKKAVVELRIRMPYELLASNTKEEHDFYLNESSFCVDNLINDFFEQYERLDEQDCFCDRVQAEFIGWQKDD